MNYQNRATSPSPALVIFLIDVSESMGWRLKDGQIKIDVAWKALQESLDRLVDLSRSGEGNYLPRFKVAIYSYTSETRDLLGGVHPISDRIAQEAPIIEPLYRTNTRAAFEAALHCLEKELPKIGDDFPAPLVCHLTDGESNEGGDPLEVAQEIQALQTPDGNVLVSNIFFSDSILREPVKDLTKWRGITSKEQLIKIDDQESIEKLKEYNISPIYSEKLYDMSSVIPESYRLVIKKEVGIELDAGAKMLFPGEATDMVRLGFVMSMATGKLPLISVGGEEKH